MKRLKCKCGETEKNFKIDIGEFFINECCEKAGYDYLGKKSEDYEKEAAAKAATEATTKEGGKSGTETKTEDGELKVEDKFRKALKKMSQKELFAMCDGREIEYKKNDSKATLREKLL